MRLTTDRRDRFALGPGELWERIGHPSAFPGWWPWLRRFEGEQLVEGAVWHCTVQPPTPYVVRFSIRIDDLVAEQSVAVSITGDIVGTAALHIEPESTGCSTRLVADLAPQKRSLRVLSVAARPVVRFGHDWVLSTGVRQFAAGLGASPPT